MDNDIEAQPTARHSTWADKPGEANDPQEIVTELRDASSYIPHSGRRLIKPPRHGE